MNKLFIYADIVISAIMAFFTAYHAWNGDYSHATFTLIIFLWAYTDYKKAKL